MVRTFRARGLYTQRNVLMDGGGVQLSLLRLEASLRFTAAALLESV